MHNSILDFNRFVVDLGHVVVFDSFSGRGSPTIDDSSSSKIGTVLISIETSVDQWTALAEKFLQILHGYSSVINTAHFNFALSQSSLHNAECPGNLSSLGLLLLSILALHLHILSLLVLGSSYRLRHSSFKGWHLVSRL